MLRASSKIPDELEEAGCDDPPPKMPAELAGVDFDPPPKMPDELEDGACEPPPKIPDELVVVV